MKLFVSYRRDESEVLAARVDERLAQAFGRYDVLRDVDAFASGAQWLDAIRGGIQQAQVMLVIIGPRWVEALRAAGGTGDYLRIEIEWAAQVDVRLVPVLIAGATMPGASDLPPSMAALAQAQAIVIQNDPMFEYGVQGLLAYLAQVVPPAWQPVPPQPPVQPFPTAASAASPLYQPAPLEGPPGQPLASQPPRQSPPAGAIAAVVSFLVVVVLVFVSIAQGVPGRLFGGHPAATTSTGVATRTTDTATAQGTAVVDCSNANTSGLHLVTPGELTVASDTTYAPAEYVDPNNPSQYDGFDMDLARELTHRLCVNPHIVTASFSTIINNLSGPALGQQPWDLSISSFTINSAREQKVDMIPYFLAGESTLVQKGNPKNIHSISDLCGLTVTAQDGTVELFELQDANGTGTGENDGGVTQPPVCQNKPINILSYPSEEDVIAQVVSGRADAAYQDQPVTDYYISLHQGQLDPGYITSGSQGTEGIVVRKDNPALETAIKNALNAMVQDKTYQRIMNAWGQQAGGCLTAPSGCPPPAY